MSTRAASGGQNQRSTDACVWRPVQPERPNRRTPLAAVRHEDEGDEQARRRCVAGRNIDLSRAAAAQIGMINAGVAPTSLKNSRLAA
jgi:hypothetical protein